METIRTDLVEALTAAGFWHVDVEFVLSPAWTTDWMTEDARARLAAYGIAPPGPTAATSGPVPLSLGVRCPQCGSLDTRESSRFGSTSCKALWVCGSCREPFDHFRAI
jgi:ring-1,2-phenylacetyl-CoA epoxidase subunit PaaD